MKRLFGMIMLMNMQIFALQTTETPGLSATMKTYYDMNLIDEAQANLVHRQFGQMRPIPQGRGKKIEFRKFDALAKATAPLTEGVTPSGKGLNMTTIEAEIEQYGDFVTQSDVLELTALDNTILEATTLLGRQAGLTLDTVVRNKLMEGTVVRYAPKIGVAGAETPVESRLELDKTCALTVKVIQQAVADLRAKNAPTVDGTNYVAIIHPYAAYDLMRDKEWQEWNKYTNPEAMYNGEIGKIAGVRFVQSSEAKIFDNTEGAPSSLGVFATLILGKNAYGVTEIEGGGLQTIVKQKGSAGTADPLDQRSSVGWKGIITAEILSQQYMVRIESCSPAFSQDLAKN